MDERQLFHGTSASFVDAICQQNFDWRVCGLHGTSYGKGKCEGQNPALLPGAWETALKEMDGGPQGSQYK